MKRQVLVEFVGALPAVMEFWGAKYAAGCGVSRDEIRNQFPEYAPEILEMQDRAAAMAYRLRQEFGPLVIAKPVGLDTLRGLWLSLKHRLRNDLHVVVNGSRVVRDAVDYEVVRKTVAEETGHPAQVA